MSSPADRGVRNQGMKNHLVLAVEGDLLKGSAAEMDSESSNRYGSTDTDYGGFYRLGAIFA